MKVAVTYENGQVFQHFGSTEQFKIYEVQNGKADAGRVVPVNGSKHGALAGFLRAHGVDTLICGGIGGGARAALRAAGIKLYPGTTGEADAQVSSLLCGTLQYNPDTLCARHQRDGAKRRDAACSHAGCGSCRH